jgi:hypothetical protein
MGARLRYTAEPSSRITRASIISPVFAETERISEGELIDKA